MTKLGGLAAAAAVLALPACKTLVVPDYNNPGLDQLEGTPSRSAVLIAAQGLMVGARNGIGARAGYVSELGIVGRESYNFDPSDPRFTTALLVGPLDPGGNAFGGAHWTFRYQNLRNSDLVLKGVDGCCSAGVLSDEEQEALRGWAKFFQAHDLLLLINTRDDLGVPTEVVEDPTGEPAPIVPRDQVFARIAQLLTEADGHLAGGGSSFPFLTSGGFADFDDPTSFREVVQALLGRVNVYRGVIEGNTSFLDDALTALGSSFLDDDPNIDAAGLAAGVYHAYSTGPGDVTLAIFDPSRVILAHPSFVSDAQAGDARLAKVVQGATVSDNASLIPSVTSDYTYTIYTGPDSPVPIIRNEELILLRAEANLELGNDADALDDINLIREQAGGLAPIDGAVWAALTDAEQLDELLYNKRYSLAFEGGHRWLDMRHYGRLTDLPVDHPSFKRFSRFPFPQRECDPRDPPPSQGCTPDPGF